MPSLNLRNPLRRDPNRPTLKQRAATLKASAARLIRKPKPLPAAGSPEAVEAFGAACRAVDRVILRRDEREALAVIPGRSRSWTSEAVYAAQAGNFSTFTGEEQAVARATPRARLEELLVLTLRRELSMAEAVKSSRIRELHALVYGDEPDPADEDEAPATFVPADDAELIALGHAFDAATVRHREACNALDAAEDRAEARMPERPTIASDFMTQESLAGLTQAATAIESEAGRSKALARIGELSAALDAWEAERDQALDDESVTEARAVADEASDAAAAIARQATALPARTLPGVWVKIRIAAFYGVCDPTASPEEGYTGEAALRSLYRDTPRLVLDAETADICIVPEASPTPAAEPDPHLVYRDRLITAMAERWASKPLGSVNPSQEEEQAQGLVWKRLNSLIEEVSALPHPRTPQGLDVLTMAAAAHFEGAIGLDGDYRDERMAANLIRGVLATTGTQLPPIFVGFGDEPDFEDRDAAAFSGPYALPGWALTAAAEA